MLQIGVVSSEVLVNTHPGVVDTFSFYTGEPSLYITGYELTVCCVGKNGRTVYRSSSETYYLYYHDWGSNLGSNWVISTDYNR